MKSSPRTFILVVLLLGASVPASAQTWPTTAAEFELPVGFGGAAAVIDSHVFVSRTGLSARFQEPPSQVGGVHVFGLIGERWDEVAELRPSDGEFVDAFGSSMSGSGKLLAVGAPAKNAKTGAAYVFERGEDGVWREMANLVDESGSEGAGFGSSVAVYGNTLVVGSPNADDKAGRVSLYQRDGGSGMWAFVRYLVADIDKGDRFGASLAVGQGALIVGAPGANDGAGRVFGWGLDAATGAWTSLGTMENPDPKRTALGHATAIHDTWAAAGAPGGGGSVYVFEWADQQAWDTPAVIGPIDSAWVTNSTRAGGGFGGALSFNGNELWIGAATAEAYGAIAVLQYDRMDKSWSPSQTVAPFKLSRGAGFGNPLAVSGDIGVGGAPGSGFLGEAYVFQRDSVGVWWEADPITSSGLDLDPIVGGRIDCENGNAAGFGCDGVELLSFLPVSAIGGGPHSTAADIWGWTDEETGREYVLANRSDGTAFVDITDAENPVFLGDLPMSETSVANLWRDVKTYKHYALIVADNVGVHGMQVFDLHQLRDVDNPPVIFEPTTVYTDINSAHNVVVNEETGFAYIVGASDGGETCGGALHMVDINDPLNPKFAGCFDNPTAPSGIHDSQCVIYSGPDGRFTDHEICLSSDGNSLSIADVTDKDDPQQLATISYPDEGYAHQGWLTEDQRYFYQNDEGDELIKDLGGTRTIIWDLQELDDPILTGMYISENQSSDHNLYVRGNLMYESNYVSGLRIIDISDPENPKEVGHLDTVPWGEDKPGFAGSWSNYPFFESGTIAVSSIREGLFLVKKTETVVP